MGRELRRVPPDWEHPRDERGHYKPLYDKDFATAAAEWIAELAAFYANRPEGARDIEFWEWDDVPPDREYYRPAWSEQARTHFQMYEDTSEGTPLSPVLPTAEAVARWCADNNVSAFADMMATYEEWLAVCRQGSCVSASMTSEGLVSGPASLRRS